MQAQGAAATGEAEEPTPQPQPPEPQPGPTGPPPPAPGQTAGQSLRGAILGQLDLPAEVLEAVTQGEPPQPQEEEPPQPPPPEVGEPPEEEEQPQPEPAAAAHVQEDWPASAKARVTEEAEKRRERTKERDAWIQRAQELEQVVQQLHGQVQQAAAPPTRDDPLRDVMDFQTLAYAVKINEDLEDWCDKNRDGALNVLVGRDQAGNELRKDYSAEQIADMKSFAKRVQKRAPERAGFLKDMEQWNAQAQKEYPDLFKDTEDARSAQAILQSFPEIRRLPDFVLVLGDVIAGVKARTARAQKNGQATGPGGQPLSAKAAAILSAPKVRPAPGVVRRGGPELGSGARSSSAGGADVHAREELEKGGFTDEALEKFVGAKLQNLRARGRGAKEATLA